MLKSTKILFLAAVVFLGLGFYSRPVQAQVASCTGSGFFCRFGGCNEPIETPVINTCSVAGEICCQSEALNIGTCTGYCSAQSCQAPLEKAASGQCENTTWSCCQEDNNCLSLGGSCTSEMCSKVGKQTVAGGTCGISASFCCGASTASTTGATSTGVLANQDNCPGGCQDSCTSSGLGVSTNQAEYCSNSGQQCCAGFGSGGTTSTTAAAGSCEQGYAPLGGAGKVCVPTGTGLSEKPVKDIVVAVLGWLLGIFGVLGILVFVISGIFYFTASGDPEQEKKAKNAMMMGIMGVVVGLAGFVVIQAIDMALKASQRF